MNDASLDCMKVFSSLNSPHQIQIVLVGMNILSLP